jgi:hypothetical protein
MCHNPAFGYAGPLGLCLGVETTIEASGRQVTVGGGSLCELVFVYIYARNVSLPISCIGSSRVSRVLDLFV